jgi:flagellar hook-associated protein 2
MAGMSVDGLVSGLDTTSLISQLLQVEAAPQQALKSKVVAQQRVVAAYQAVNARFVALQTAAEALIGDTAWDPVKATSSSTTVTATATAGAQAGSLSFFVDTVASAYSAMTSVAAPDSTSA